MHSLGRVCPSVRLSVGVLACLLGARVAHWAPITSSEQRAPPPAVSANSGVLFSRAARGGRTRAINSANFRLRATLCTRAANFNRHPRAREARTRRRGHSCAPLASARVFCFLFSFFLFFLFRLGITIYRSHVHRCGVECVFVAFQVPSCWSSAPHRVSQLFIRGVRDLTDFIARTAREPVLVSFVGGVQGDR